MPPDPVTCLFSSCTVIYFLSQAQEPQIFKFLTTSKDLRLFSKHWYSSVVSENVLKITFSGFLPNLNYTLKSLWLRVNFDGTTAQSCKFMKVHHF